MKKKFDFNFNTKKDKAIVSTATVAEKKHPKKQFKDKTPFENDISAPITTIYVGNLNYKRDEKTIKELFTPFGYVRSVKLVFKPGSELKSGIAFVQMTNAEKADKAVKTLNGKVIDDRTLKVSIANDRNSTK